MVNVIDHNTDVLVGILKPKDILYDNGNGTQKSERVERTLSKLFNIKTRKYLTD